MIKNPIKLHESQRGYFAYHLFDVMRDHADVWLLLGDLGYGVFDHHRDAFPERVINTGAAEQTMLDMAVGLAYSGKIPVCYSITPFLLYRGFETIRTYINHEKVAVKLIGSGRADDYKHDGFSHFAGDDYKLFEVAEGSPILPNVEAYWPGSLADITYDWVADKLLNDKPTYINLRR